VNSRITFGAELRYAMHVRGLSLTEVARRSGVAVATASSAALGRPVNVTTALRVARAVAAQPVIPELLDWVERPPSYEVGARGGGSMPQPSTSGAHRASVGDRGISRRGPPRPAPTAAAGPLRIAVD
jgi:hypothetical protein